jgi:hypothetical protein
MSITARMQSSGRSMRGAVLVHGAVSIGAVTIRKFVYRSPAGLPEPSLRQESVSGWLTVRTVRVFLTSDTLASMPISHYYLDSFANELFNWPQAMAKRELL